MKYAVARSLTPRQMAVLHVLVTAHPDLLTASQVAARMGLRTGVISALNRLYRMGLIETVIGMQGQPELYRARLEEIKRAERPRTRMGCGGCLVVLLFAGLITILAAAIYEAATGYGAPAPAPPLSRRAP